MIAGPPFPLKHEMLKSSEVSLLQGRAHRGEESLIAKVASITKKNVELDSGRIIQVSEGGDPAGVPVFSLHGSPGSRILFYPHVQDARKRGIRLIGYSRPGYGGSTRRKGRRIVDGASDVAGIADSIGIEKFAVWGFSGGGACALGCAAMLPARVVAASSLSTLGPYGVEGFDFFSGMGEYNVEDFKLMMRDQPQWEAKSKRDSEVMEKQTKADRMNLIGSLLSEVDKAANTDELDDFFHAQFEEGFRNGIDGAIDDNLALVAPWGFELSSIKVPLQIWHGKQDRFVPFSHGQWLASKTPQAEVHLNDDDGHLTMFVNRIPEVQGWCASQFRSA